MIRNVARNFNQPNQVEYHQGLFYHAKDLEFQFPLQKIGPYFILTNIPDKALRFAVLFLRPAPEKLDGKGHQLWIKTVDFEL